MGNVENYIIPKPDIYLGPVAQAMPTVTGTLGGTVDTTGFTSVGFLSEGSKVTLEHIEERRKFRPMNKLTPIGAANIAKGLKITLSMAESDLAAWQVAMCTAAESGGVLKDNGTGAINFFQMLVITAGKVWQFRMVAVDGNAKTELDDTQEEQIEVVFEAYEYTAATGGEQVWRCHTRTA